MDQEHVTGEEQTQQPTPEQVAQDNEAAFASGFNEMRGIETPATPASDPAPEKAEPEPEKSEPESEPPKAEEPPQKQPWEDVLDKFQSRIRNIEGHIGGIASQLKTIQAASKAVEKTGIEAPTAAQVEQAVTSKRWDEIRQDYPEWAEAMDERLAAERAASKAPAVDLDGIRKEVGTTVSSAEEKFRQELRKRDELLVEFKHPGWKDVARSAEFNAWFKAQGADIQRLAESEDAMDAIRLFDTYKSVKKTVKQDKEQRLRSAVTPQGSPARPPTINDEDAFNQGFAKVRPG